MPAGGRLSSVAVHARPSISAQSIFTRDGSAMAAATAAIAFSSIALLSGGKLVLSMGRPGFGDLCGQLIIIRQQNKVIRMVAVLSQDRHAACPPVSELYSRTSCATRIR